MSQTTREHRADAPQKVCCGVVTVSDTRRKATDSGGQLVARLLEQHGHHVAARQIVPDEPDRLREVVASLCRQEEIDVILLTGGTGVSRRDQTYEVIRDLLAKPLPGYGELFRMLSYDEIGAAAMLSRAVGGLIDRTVVLTMPGSPAAVRLAMEKLILPEIGHLVREARR